MGVTMFRSVVAGLLIVLAVATARADDVTTLRQGETVQVASGVTQAVAFYTVDRKGMDLTMLMTDADGDLIRTRMRMDDGQAHSILLEPLEDGAPGHRYTFLRLGATVQITAREVHAPTQVAVR